MEERIEAAIMVLAFPFYFAKRQPGATVLALAAAGGLWGLASLYLAMFNQAAGLA